MRDPAQVQALSSPTRHNIHQIVHNQGEVSVREIGELLGRQPAALYRHIDLLVDVGVLKEVGSRTTTKRDAKLYSTALDYIAYDPKNPEMVEALCSFAQNMTKRAGVEVAQSFRTGKARTRSGRHARDTHVSKVFGWLDAETLDQVNEHIDAIMRLMDKKSRAPDTELISIMVSLAPLPVHTNTPA